MRILLVQPRKGKNMGWRNLARLEPLGLEMVAGALSGHDVRILDMTTGDMIDSAVTSFKPDLCGISCSFTADVYSGLQVARELKAATNNAFVCVGGHHATLNPGDFYAEGVDAVVTGEGETIIGELADCLDSGRDLREVVGLAINTPQKQVLTGMRPLLANLDELPYPARRLTEHHRREYYFSFNRPLALMETARGCPYSCTFCSVWRFYESRCRMKSPERVVAELAQVEERHVLFTDDNFLLNVPRAKRIAELITAAKIKKRYSFQARTDTIVRHPELIAQWKELGLDGVFVGLEKIDDSELAALNKHNSASNNDEALAILKKNKVFVVPAFIVDPAYGPAEFRRLRDFIVARRLFMPSITVLTPLPGTVLFAEHRDRMGGVNYNLFDLMHAVIPTKMRLEDFYAELAALYRAAWGATSNADKLRLAWMAMSHSGWSLRHLRRVLTGSKLKAREPRDYLWGHHQPHPAEATPVPRA